MLYPQLPEAQFAVMQVVWEQEEPVSGKHVAKSLLSQKGWKRQTVHTLLSRLVKKGFLSVEKQDTEMCYKPLVNREDYLRQETSRFIEVFHKNSLSGLVFALESGTKISDSDLAELMMWLKAREKEEQNSG